MFEIESPYIRGVKGRGAEIAELFRRKGAKLGADDTPESFEHTDLYYYIGYDRRIMVTSGYTNFGRKLYVSPRNRMFLPPKSGSVRLAYKI